MALSGCSWWSDANAHTAHTPKYVRAWLCARARVCMCVCACVCSQSYCNSGQRDIVEGWVLKLCFSFLFSFSVKYITPTWCWLATTTKHEHFTYALFIGERVINWLCDNHHPSPPPLPKKQQTTHTHTPKHTHTRAREKNDNRTWRAT